MTARNPLIHRPPQQQQQKAEYSQNLRLYPKILPPAALLQGTRETKLGDGRGLLGTPLSTESGDDQPAARLVAVPPRPRTCRSDVETDPARNPQPSAWEYLVAVSEAMAGLDL